MAMTITLLKGQKLIDYDDLEILEGGDFKETDMVSFCHPGESVTITDFQADFVLSRLRG